MALQPAGHLVDAGDVGTGVSVVLLVGLQLRKPAWDLAFQKAVRLAEIGEPDGDVIDGTEFGQRVGHRQPHAEPHLGIAGMQRW